MEQRWRRREVQLRMSPMDQHLEFESQVRICPGAVVFGLPGIEVPRWQRGVKGRQWRLLLVGEAWWLVKGKFLFRPPGLKCGSVYYIAQNPYGIGWK